MLLYYPSSISSTCIYSHSKNGTERLRKATEWNGPERSGTGRNGAEQTGDNGDVGRCLEMPEQTGDVGRCREMSGDISRCLEMDRVATEALALGPQQRVEGVGRREDGVDTWRGGMSTSSSLSSLCSSSWTLQCRVAQLPRARKLH